MKFWLYFLGVVLICSNVYWVYEKCESNKVTDVLLEITADNSKKVSELRAFKKNRLHELVFNGKKIPQNCELIDENGKKHQLNNLIDGNKLILRYSNLNCHTCIEEQVKNLNAYADSIGIENILLFTTYDNASYMNRFRKVNKIRFPIYNLTDIANGIFEDIGLPYFFVLTKESNRVNTMCVPLKEAPGLTNEYMDLVCEKYFKE